MSAFDALTAAVERLTDRIEASSTLDSWGKAVARVVNEAVPSGPAKDLLSGTLIGHPVHPLLTDVTIGAWTSAVFLDLAGESRAADRLILTGMLTALPTAVTGVSDLADATAREDRSVGIAHAVSNLTALSLYALSYVLRRSGARRTGVTMSFLGATAATAGGYLGGHLSFRRGVGVDQTAFEKRPTRWTEAMADGDLADDKPTEVKVAGVGVLLVRHGGRVHALANRCTHRGGPLSKGTLRDSVIECPWHYSRFRLEDGSVARGPATAPQPAYETRVVDGRIEVRARRAGN